MRRALCACALLLLTTACGDDLCEESETCPPEAAGGPAGGGEVGGASAAGGSGGGPVATVTSTIEARDGYGDPVAQLVVIGNDAAGALVAEGVTDADGKVELVLPAGGSVSAVYDTTYTYADANHTVVRTRLVDSILFNGLPPDAVHMNVAINAAQASTDPMTLELAAVQRVGATSYDAHTSCANTETGPASVIAMQTPTCRGDGKLDVLLLARNAAGAIIDHARIDDITAVPGEFASYEMEWEGTPVGAVDFETIHIPDGAVDLYISASARNPQSGGLVSAWQAATFPSLSDQHTASLSHLASYGSDHCQFAQLMLATDDSTQESVHRERCKPVADLSPVVLDATKLSRFRPSVPSRDPLVIDLTETWSGALGEVILIDTQWRRGGDIGRWRANLAPGSERAQFPTLPAAMSDHILAASDDFIAVEVGHKHDLGGTEGFAAAVAVGLPLATRDFESAFARLVP